MKHRVLFLVAVFSQSSYSQPWSTFLNPSRAIDWTSVGFTIPNYTANCPTQPTLTANSSSAAAANTTAIQNALASCDATHNVVNIPAGTYSVAGLTYGTQGKQVIRGVGPNSTDIIFTAEASCGGWGHGACMIAGNWTYSGDSSVLPPSGSRQCLWSGGYPQGTTTITLSSCGGTPPLNQTIILDQANDSTDTNGVYICDSSATNCTYETSATNGSPAGRKISGAWHSLQQVVYVTGVTSLGGGSYSVTISPGVYSTNIRSSQNPGVWWPGFVQNDGIENLTLDGGSLTDTEGGIVGMVSCYQCWAKNIRFINAARNDVFIYQSLQAVIRDSYFYGAQSHYTESYVIEPGNSSAFLIENNILQQVTFPIVFGTGTGAVVDYNFDVYNIYTNGTWNSPTLCCHNAGNNFNLFEGNVQYGIEGDNTWGGSAQITTFRNLLTGFQPGTSNTTVPFIFRAFAGRVVNFVGNVLGQPGYHTQYAAYATSGTAFSGAANEYKSIYDLGGGGTGDVCGNNPGASSICDPLIYSTAMRWGNYDVVNAAVRWDSTEASPVAVPYVNANFTSSYFGSLAHTLPASLVHTSKPSWWPSGKAWPAIGPDVSSGNVGICSGGTYANWMATSSGQCTGGNLSAAWASYATSIPAQDCYLNAMGGPPDGSGSVLSFDASLCYASSGIGSGVASPSGVTATVH